MKSSTYYFHVKTKILADFQICISAPLNTSKNIMTLFTNPAQLRLTIKTKQHQNKLTNRKKLQLVKKNLCQTILVKILIVTDKQGYGLPLLRVVYLNLSDLNHSFVTSKTFPEIKL